MAFVQYTHCTPTASFSRSWSKTMNKKILAGGLMVGGLVLMIIALFAAAAIPVVGIALVLAGGGTLFAGIVATFEYLLGGKLICLGSDEIAVGRLLSTETASSKSGLDSMDNDYCLNVLLCPHVRNPDDYSSETYKDEEIPPTDTTDPANFQDFLVEPQAASGSHGCPFTGYDKPGSLHHANFHLELEGSRIYDMYGAFLAAWALLVIAAIAAAAVLAIPGVGWLIAFLIMLFAALFGGAIAAGTWLGSSDGVLSDPDPVPGTQPVGVLENGDYLVAYGTWVFDAGHNDDDTPVGWNEFHPVKYLGKAYSCATKEQAVNWKDKIVESNDPAIRSGTQGLPQNKWKVHPLIDGCQPNTPVPLR